MDEQRTFLSRPVEAVKAVLRTLGFAALAILGVQFLTGIALSLHYVPTPELAWESVRVLEAKAAWGTLTRALHHWGTLAVIALVIAQLLRVMVFRSYRQPHRATWWTGLLLLGLLIALDSTGQLLPWTEQGYLATEVRAGIVGSAPVGGDMARELVLGGDRISGVTLTRFHVLHVVILPLLLVGALLLHLFLLRRHGLGSTVAPANTDGRQWFPGQLACQAVVGTVACGALFYWSATHAAPLGGMMAPGDDGFVASPEYYMLWLNQLLKMLAGEWQLLGTFVVPSLVALWLLLVPILDPAGGRGLRRLVVVFGTLAILAGIAGLTRRAVQQDQPDNRVPLPIPLGLTDAERQGYVLFRQNKCMDCHAGVLGEPFDLPEEESENVVYGVTDHDAPDINDFLIEDMADFTALLEDPEESLGAGTSMPSFSHVPLEQREKIGTFIIKWVEWADTTGVKLR